MSTRRREFREGLQDQSLGSSEEILGWEVSGDWRNICFDYTKHITSIVKELPDYADLIIAPHDAMRTFSWAQIRVSVAHKVKFSTVKHKEGYLTIVPYYLEVRDDDTSSETRFNKKLKARGEPRIALRKSDSVVVAEKPKHQIAKAINSEFNYLTGKIDTRDIREFVQKVVYQLCGVKMKEVGTDWFVPYSDKAKEALPKLQSIVQEAGGDLYIPALPKSDSNWKRKSASGAKSSLTSEYKAVLKDTKTFVKKLFSGNLTQDSTLKNRLEKMKFIRSRAELFQGLLELRSDNLTKAIELLSDATNALIMGSGEYRAHKKRGGDDEKEAEKSLKKWAKKAEKLLREASDFLPEDEIEKEEKVA